jgi:hypothetical protein
LLNSLSSDNVKKIELITAPPSKYDADGNAGIINVVLRKNDAFGTNGSFKLGAGVATREKMDAGFNINHHVEKVNLFGSYNTSFDNSRTRIDSYRRFLNQGSMEESDAISKREAITLFQNIRMGLDYTINSKTVFSVLATGYVRDWDAEAVNKIDYLENSAMTRKSNLKMQELSKWIHGMGNINLRHSIQEDEVLDFNIDYLNYYNDNPSDYQIEKIRNDGQLESGENIKVTKRTPINIVVGTFDYSKQISPKLKLEAGLKSTVTFFENKVGVTYFNNGIGTIDNDLTNNYALNEDISAVYASANFNITDKTGIAGRVALRIHEFGARFRNRKGHC